MLNDDGDDDSNDHSDDNKNTSKHMKQPLEGDSYFLDPTDEGNEGRSA